MANVRWKGAAMPVAEVKTIVVGGVWVAGDTLTLTINGKDLVLTVGVTVTTTAIATAIKEMWNGDTITGDATRNETGDNVPEFAEVTATVNSSTVTLTHNTKGTPFTLSVNETSAAGTLTLSTVTAGTGPNHWDNADNWDTGSVPVSTDTVYLEESDIDIKYGLAQSAVTLTALHIASSFTGDVGLPEINSDGGSSYLEYRAQYLAIGATTVNIGDGDGQGSGRLKINFGSVATTLNVRNTGAGAEQDLEALIIKGTHVSNVLNLSRGSVGIAVYGGETATFATLRVGYVTSQLSDAQLRCGAGCTLTTLEMSGGQVELNSGLTTVTKTAGELRIVAGNVTTLTDDKDTTWYLGTGTIGTANVGSKATLDFTQDPRARTVTNANIYLGATVRDPASTVTWTNPPRLVRCRLADCDLDFGINRTYAIG